MTRRAGRKSLAGAKVIASVLAGALALSGSVAGGSFGGTAYAQQAKPAAPKAAAATDKKAPTATDKKAAANANDPKARYAAGEAKFKAGDYAGALDDFQFADAAKPTPQAARYIGLCQDNLQRYPEAVAAYERFLADVPPKLAAQGDEVRKRVDVIKAMPGKVHVDSDPKGASVVVDGKPATGATPLDVELPPGKHTLKLSADAHEDQTKDVDVVYASKQDVTVTLPVKAAPPPVVAVTAPAAPPPETTPAPATPPPAPRSKVPAYVTGGLAIAAAGVGTIFGVMAINDHDEFNKNPTTATADDGENHALIADMAFGVAITLGVTSAVLFFTNDETPPPAAASNAAPRVAEAKPKAITITPTPFVTRNGGGAGALVRF